MALPGLFCLPFCSENFKRVNIVAKMQEINCKYCETLASDKNLLDLLSQIARNCETFASDKNNLMSQNSRNSRDFRLDYLPYQLEIPVQNKRLP